MALSDIADDEPSKEAGVLNVVSAERGGEVGPAGSAGEEAEAVAGTWVAAAGGAAARVMVL